MKFSDGKIHLKSVVLLANRELAKLHLLTYEEAVEEPDDCLQRHEHNDNVEARLSKAEDKNPLLKVNYAFLNRQRQRLII